MRISYGAVGKLRHALRAEVKQNVMVHMGEGAKNSESYLTAKPRLVCCLLNAPN